MLEALRPRLPVAASAIRDGLARVELLGRFQVVPGQPALVLDVAHNPHAVAALARNLDQMGFFPRTHVVFGAMRDKDIAQMLRGIAPLADRWYFCDLPTPRAIGACELRDLHADLAATGAIRGADKAPVECHPTPASALRAARAAADPADRIVAFGSFFIVGGVMQGHVAAMDAGSAR